MTDKNEIRRTVRARRKQLAPEERRIASARICGKILAREDVSRAIAARKKIAVYLATPDEIDLSLFIRAAWNAGCDVLVPAWRNGKYALVPYRRDSPLAKGPMGVLEPCGEDAPAAFSDPAVWIVPGLAFTAGGARIGYGGGWYDRMLAEADPSAVAIGVAHRFQMFGELPAGTHDRPLDGVEIAETEQGAAEFQFPRVLAWELTKRCPMKCVHCRACAADSAPEGELCTEECLKVLDSLAERKPMVIWTGGEPMVRSDLDTLVRRAAELGIRSVLAPCGAFATAARLKELKDAGISACSFSVDGPDRDSHDAFRGAAGAWDAVHAAMAAAREAEMPFQVNTVVRKNSLSGLDRIYAHALDEGATRLDLFFLVPTGRGAALAGNVPDGAEVSRIIGWAQGKRTKLTCCPQAGTCIGGRGFAFLSSRGDLQPCGFVQKPCGNIRDCGFDFALLAASAANPLGASGNCRSARESAAMPHLV